MIVRSVTFLLSLLVTAALAGEAHAEHRQKRHVIIEEQVYAPGFFEHIPGVRTLFGDYALTEEEYNALYGPDEQDFDESYYEPKPAAPAVKPKAKPTSKQATKPPAAKPSAKSAAAPAVTKTADDTQTASVTPKSDSAAPSKSSAKTASEPASGKGLSCEKATGIVSGYGFTAVKPQNCNGKVYAFNATRGGSNFAIKLDPANGELTEVKKLQ